MNYSKFSNDSGDWQADWALIESYVKALSDAPENFYEQQIDIINPDVILTMNLELKLKELGEIKPIEFGQNASYYRLVTKNKSYLLIDLYHFSSIKSKEECFYHPVIKGMKEYAFIE